MTDTGSVFDATADDYDKEGFHRIIAEELVTGLRPAPELVLDVATGTGFAAFAALRHLGAGRVLGIDVSPAMLGRAEKTATELDPDGRITWQVAPAVPAPVEPSSVDLVLCASAVHFLGMAALEDWLRVLRPGGQVAFTLPNGKTFKPSSGPLDELIAAAAMPIPVDEPEAVAIANRAGFTHATARRFEVHADRPRVAFLVHAQKP